MYYIFQYLPLFIVIIIIVLILNYSSNLNEGFYRPLPIWNISTRIPRLYYDMRGDPNIAYRRLVYGDYIPFGYIFGPYLYDAQGNLLVDNRQQEYIR